MGQHIYTGPHGTMLKLPSVMGQQAAALFETQKYQLPANTKLPVAAARAEGQYVVVTFGQDDDGQRITFNGCNTWAFFVGDGSGPPHAIVKRSDIGHKRIPGQAHKGDQIEPSEWRLNSIAKGITHHFEGCKLKSYKCPSGLWTVGWGNTFWEDGKPVEPGITITQERADALADFWLHRFVGDVAQLVRVPLRGSAIAAVTSLAYNIGPGAFKDSTFLKHLNDGSAIEELQYQIRLWDSGNMPGLIARRNCEAAALMGLNWRDHLEDYTDHNA